MKYNDMKQSYLFGKNKFSKFKIFLIFIFIYLFCGIGFTYAYFVFKYENSSTIVGSVVNIDATLTVERVVGTTKKLVPLNTDALPNALLGTGSSNGACIDNLGNLSCQVYKITLTNNASRLQHLVGTIELYSKEGNNNVYSNLKWRELTDIKTVKSESVVNGMSKSILVSGLTLDSKQSKTWYVGVWLNEIDVDQKNIDKGEFEGEVKFEVIESLSEGISGNFYNEFTENVMISNASNDASIDFSKTSEATSTNGIYLRDGTENNAFPIYYYRGNVNNNLIFAGFCWKIVRTTETGGLKLIYNGIPSAEGACNNTGTATQIGTKTFNTLRTSPAYVGYMYGTPYIRAERDMSTDVGVYVYGSDVRYSNGTYTLTGLTTSGDWTSIYSSGLNDYHYTCFTTENTCDNVYYIHYIAPNYAYYIMLNGAANIEEALSNMLDKNTTSSIIKGNNQTSGTLDWWYSQNISGTNYENYIEDTVWCNDRSIHSLGGWNPNGGGTKNNYILLFSGYKRAYVTYTPDLTCLRRIDKFTVSENNGNGDLDYPVGLLTSDELMLAGAKHGTQNSSYYLNSGSDFWIMSPYRYNYLSSYGFVSISTGELSGIYVDYARGVRPSISLKYGVTISTEDRDGSVEKPYVVEIGS